MTVASIANAPVKILRVRRGIDNAFFTRLTLSITLGEKMKIKLSKNTFTRVYDNGKIGYINNQLTYHDRIYDGVGASFLLTIKREAREVDEIVAELSEIYDAPAEVLKADFIEFATSLFNSGFVLMGETEIELNGQERSFTYSMDNPKTISDNFTQPGYELTETDTQKFALTHDMVKPRLSSLQLELTTRCNERCIHCYIPNGKKNHGIDMPWNMVKSVIDQFVDLGGIHITLSGGEALLHKDIAKILRYCREKDLQISLLTNLALLHDDLIPVLKEVNLSLIQVSLYSMDPEIHDTITTVQGSFKKTKDAIEKLRKEDIPLQISCPIMKANKIGYDKVLDYARSLKIKAQTDYVMMAQSDLDTSNLANRISLEETRQVLLDILNYDVRYHELMDEVKPIKSIPEEEYKGMPICGAGLNEVCVAANGDVFPCAGWQSYVVGNVKKDSLRQIWENSDRLKAIRKIKHKDFPKCLSCSASEYCNVCLVRNFNENDGDMFAINEHYCKVAHLNKQLVEEFKGNVWLQKKC